MIEQFSEHWDIVHHEQGDGPQSIPKPLRSFAYNPRSTKQQTLHVNALLLNTAGLHAQGEPVESTSAVIMDDTSSDILLFCNDNYETSEHGLVIDRCRMAYRFIFLDWLLYKSQRPRPEYLKAMQTSKDVMFTGGKHQSELRKVLRSTKQKGVVYQEVLQGFRDERIALIEQLSDLNVVSVQNLGSVLPEVMLNDELSS